jgi:hypothetical protein
MNTIPEPTPHVQSDSHPWWEDAHPAFPDEPGLSPEDEAWYVQHVSQRYGDPAELKPANLSDLARSVAGYLTGLGLEPDVEDGPIVRVQFLGRMVELSDCPISGFTKPPGSGTRPPSPSAQAD